MIRTPVGIEGCDAVATRGRRRGVFPQVLPKNRRWPKGGRTKTDRSDIGGIEIFKLLDKTRDSYTAVWYDGLGRKQTVADYGTNGGTGMIERPASAPAVTSTEALVTTYEYDDYGRQDRTTRATKAATDANPVATVTRQFFDELDRVTMSIENFLTDTEDSLGKHATSKYNVFGELIEATDASGKVTSYRYDRAGRQTRTAVGLLENEDPYNVAQDVTAAVRDPAWDTVDGSGYGGKYLRLDAQETGEATWVYSGLEAGQKYEILATWIAAAGNARNVPIQFLDGDGTTVLDSAVVDQQDLRDDGHLDGYDWQSLGVVTVGASGTLYVKVNVSAALTGNAVINGVRVLDTSDVTTSVYDTLGRLTTTNDRLGHATTRDYDDLGRPVMVSDANGDFTIMDYDLAGRTISILDAAGNTTDYQYDNLDHKIDEEVNAAAGRNWRYDTHGNLIYAQDRNGRVRAFTYDELDRQHKEMWFDDDTDYNAYMADPDDPNHQPSYTCTTTYDLRNRMATLVDQDGSNATISSLTRQYDALDRLRWEQIANPGTPSVLLTSGYELNDLGQAARNDNLRTTLAAVTGGTLDFLNSYHYDALDRLDQLQQTSQAFGNAVAGKFVTFTYDDAGRFGLISRYAGTNDLSPLVARSQYAYDNAGRMQSLIHYRTDPASPLASYAWDYDGAGRLVGMDLQWKENGNSESDSVAYTYDAQAQLTSASYESGAEQFEGYTYDENGNRTAVAHGVTASTYATAAGNRVESDGVYTYQYDTEGNREYRWRDATGNGNVGALGDGDQEITQYLWDHRNRLTAVRGYATHADLLAQTSNLAVDYVYDALNRRIARTVDLDGVGEQGATTERYVWDSVSGNVVLDFVDPTPTTSVPSRRYLHGPAVDQVLAQENVGAGGDVLWMLADHLGTNRDVVHYAGGDTSVVTHYAVDSFGNVTATVGALSATRYVFTSQEYDAATCMYYMDARWYDAGTGGFISEDPLGFAAGDANQNRYCGNAPTMRTDPSGMAEPLYSSAYVDETSGDYLLSDWTERASEEFIATLQRRQAERTPPQVAESQRRLLNQAQADLTRLVISGGSHLEIPGLGLTSSQASQRLPDAQVFGRL